MKARDVAIVVALLLVGGFAVADALRGGGGGRGAAPETTASGRERDRPRPGPTPAPPERFAPLPLGGTLAFADARDCRLRAVDLVSGRERRLRPLDTACDVSAPWAGARLAIGTGRGDPAGAEFRLLRLEGTAIRAVAAGRRFGPLLWSPRGLVAWCDTATSGIELRELAPRELRPRDVKFCPRAYVGEKLAATRDRDLVVGGRTVLRAPAHIEQVVGGIDGSIALVLEGGRVLRRAPNGRTLGFRLAPEALPATLVFTQDTCAAAALGVAAVAIVDLGCFRGRGQVTTVSTDNCTDRWESANSECASYPAPRVFPGTAAAWSPDGSWLAVADADGIAFHRLVERYRVVRWNAGAAALAWLG